MNKAMLIELIKAHGNCSNNKEIWCDECRICYSKHGSAILFNKHFKQHDQDAAAYLAAIETFINAFGKDELVEALL